MDPHVLSSTSMKMETETEKNLPLSHRDGISGNLPSPYVSSAWWKFDEDPVFESNITREYQYLSSGATSEFFLRFENAFTIIQIK